MKLANLPKTAAGARNASKWLVSVPMASLDEQTKMEKGEMEKENHLRVMVSRNKKGYGGREQKANNPCSAARTLLTLSLYRLRSRGECDGMERSLPWQVVS